MADVSPFQIFTKWLFDGAKNSKLDSSILKYNSPVTPTFVMGLFYRNAKLNNFLNTYFNSMNLYYLDKEEFFNFIKKCVQDFKVGSRTLIYSPRRNSERLFDELRNRLSTLKNDDIDLLSQIIEKSKDREIIYNSLSLKPSPKVSKGNGNNQKNGVSLEDFLKTNFVTIEVR